MSKLQKLAEDYFVNGNQNALIEIYEYFEKKIAWQKWNKGDFSEVQSNMNLAVAQALSSYDINKKIQLSTYVWTCFKNLAGTQKIRKYSKKRGEGKEVLSLNAKVKNLESEKEFQETIEDKQNQPLSTVINKIDFYKMIQHIDDKKDRFILETYYEGWNQTEISKVLKVTNAAICIRMKKLAQSEHADLIYKTLKGE